MQMPWKSDQDENRPVAFRLLPVLMIAAGALLAMKGVHLVFDPRLDSIAVSQAIAQENTENANEDAAGETGEQTDAGDANGEAGDGAEGTDKVENTEGDDAGAGKPAETAKAADGTNAKEGEREILSNTEIEVLERLSERRKKLEKREKSLELREKLLLAAEKKIEERLTEIKEIEQRVELSFGKRSKEKSERFKNLVSMYENMKPKDAARIFNTLEMEVLLSVVQNMNARKMAAVLAKMDSIAAQRLTVELAAIAAGQQAQSAETTSELPPVIENDEG